MHHPLRPPTTDGSFIADGLCAQTDPEAFFPDAGRPGDDSPRLAKRLCLTCPVRSECLEYALAEDQRFGIWGGMTAAQRRREAKRRREGGDLIGGAA